MSRRTLALCLGIVLGVLGVGLARVGFAFEEDFGLGLLFRLRGPIEDQVPPDVVVVAIDDSTPERLGLGEEIDRWRRSIHAELIDNLVAEGAALIVFDVLFLEPRDEDEDAILEDAIARSGRVVLLDLLTETEFATLRRSLERFRNGARATAPFVLPERDTLWAFWTFREHAGEVWPTLPVTVLQVQALESFTSFLVELAAADFGPLDAVSLRDADITNTETLRELMGILRSELQESATVRRKLRASLRNTNQLTTEQSQLWTTLVDLYGGEHGSYHLNFYGQPRTIPTIPYHEAVSERGLDVGGKVVFVGEGDPSRVQQADRFETVYTGEFEALLSGVEAAATAYANLRTNGMLERRIDLHLVSLFVMGILGFGAAILLPGVRAVAGVVGIGALYLGVALTLFSFHQLVLPVFTPLALQLPLALVAGLFLQFRGERKRSERFRPWVPDKAADARVEAGMVYGVILRTDIVGSTALSDSLSDASEYGALLGRYLDVVRGPTVRLGGRVLETRGDDVMCFWESPRAEEGIRIKACQAALEIRRDLQAFNRGQVESRRLEVRIGLNAGSVPVGEVGPVGDVLNTVSRIERANERLGTRILASEETVAGLDGFVLRRLGLFALPKKTKPVAMVELLGLTGEVAPEDLELIQRFQNALAEFNARNWLQSALVCEEILSTWPDDIPARLYLDKCHEYLTQGPPEYDETVVRL